MGPRAAAAPPEDIYRRAGVSLDDDFFAGPLRRADRPGGSDRRGSAALSGLGVGRSGPAPGPVSRAPQGLPRLRRGAPGGTRGERGRDRPSARRHGDVALSPQSERARGPLRGGRARPRSVERGPPAPQGPDPPRDEPGRRPGAPAPRGGRARRSQRQVGLGNDGGRAQAPGAERRRHRSLPQGPTARPDVDPVRREGPSNDPQPPDRPPTLPPARQGERGHGAGAAGLRGPPRHLPERPGAPLRPRRSAGPARSGRSRARCGRPGPDRAARRPEARDDRRAHAPRKRSPQGRARGVPIGLGVLGAPRPPGARRARRSHRGDRRAGRARRRRPAVPFGTRTPQHGEPPGAPTTRPADPSVRPRDPRLPEDPRDLPRQPRGHAGPRGVPADLGPDRGRTRHVPGPGRRESPRGRRDTPGRGRGPHGRSGGDVPGVRGRRHRGRARRSRQP